MGFTSALATVFEWGEPGTRVMGFTEKLAGLDGRTARMGFRYIMATVFEAGEPGSR
jgi:hypothetical protein